MFKEEDVKKDESNDNNEVKEDQNDGDKEDSKEGESDSNAANPPKPDEIPAEDKKPESEYEDVTDPEFDVFNSDDSTERKRIVRVDYNWGGRGFIQKRYIKKKLNIFVKTFSGDRKKYQLTVDINDKIESLISKYYPTIF